MPLIVDHEERRREIAAAVAQLVAESGLEAVKIRDIARLAGIGPTSIAHYFRNKQELLIFTYAEARKRAIQRMEKAMAADRDLLSCLEEVLPMDKERTGDWKTWFGFWSKAVIDPDMVDERETSRQKTFALYQDLMERARDRGELPADTDCAYQATRFVTLINGLASHVILDPASWPPQRQRQFLAAEIELCTRYTEQTRKANAGDIL